MKDLSMEEGKNVNGYELNEKKSQLKEVNRNINPYYARNNNSNYNRYSKSPSKSQLNSSPLTISNQHFNFSPSLHKSSSKYFN
jgi:hypothetical protein